jgi:hypothetical protein
MCEEVIMSCDTAGVDVNAAMDAPCRPEALFALVDHLDRYPEWMSLVHRVEPEPADAEGRPAWTVELRARVGPLARSKRLRMVRTRHVAPTEVVFERVELDGRRHAPWVLRAQVSVGVRAEGEASRLAMSLHYGGALWTGGLLERVLTDQISDGRQRLATLVTAAQA